MVSRPPMVRERVLRDTVNRVLLIEDDPGDADLTRERLWSMPGHRFSVDHAATLSTALDILTAGVIIFDIIVVDLNLPDSRGLETLTRVRVRSRARHDHRALGLRRARAARSGHGRGRRRCAA